MRSRSLVSSLSLALLLCAIGCGGRVAPDPTKADEANTGTTKGGNAGSPGSPPSFGGSQGSDGSNGATTGGPGGSGGGSGGGGSGGGAATGTAMCTDLPSSPLMSLDEARAALANPFPGAWQLCAGYSFFLCPKSAPFVSFNASATQASCGNLYEGGFVASTVTSVSLSQNEYGNVLLRWQVPDGSVTLILQAFGSFRGGDSYGPHAISLSQWGDPPPPPAMMVPAPPLP